MHFGSPSLIIIESFVSQTNKGVALWLCLLSDAPSPSVFCNILNVFAGEYFLLFCDIDMIV